MKIKLEVFVKEVSPDCREYILSLPVVEEGHLKFVRSRTNLADRNLFEFRDLLLRSGRGSRRLPAEVGPTIRRFAQEVGCATYGRMGSYVESITIVPYKIEVRFRNTPDLDEFDRLVFSSLNNFGSEVVLTGHKPEYPIDPILVSV